MGRRDSATKVATTAFAGALLFLVSACSPASLACPDDSCPTGFSVTIHRDKTAPFDAGSYAIEIESDVGNANITCALSSDGAACDGDGPSRALLGIGSVIRAADLTAVVVTIHGTPTRATITLTKGPATLGTQTFTTPTYTSLESCGGQKCKVASASMTVP